MGRGGISTPKHARRLRRFVERIFTAVTTLKLQGRGVLDFLTDTLRTHRRGLPPPSLLPFAQAPQLAYAA